MICRALLMREVCVQDLSIFLTVCQAIDEWVFMTPQLRCLLLSEEDWKILSQIATILQVRSKPLLNLD